MSQQADNWALRTVKVLAVFANCCRSFSLVGVSLGPVRWALCEISGDIKFYGTDTEPRLPFIHGVTACFTREKSEVSTAYEFQSGVCLPSQYHNRYFVLLISSFKLICFFNLHNDGSLFA